MLEIIDIPADSHSVASLTAYARRQERARAVLTRRRHVPWRVRKFTPGLAIELEQQWAEYYQAAARRYAASAPGGS